MADDLQLRVMALHLIERGGKRLRPALLFLAARFGTFEAGRLQPAAAALEILHVASLYHDDVMDRAPQRRRGSSTNARWGNLAATLAGTYLFSRATALLASLGDVPNRLASQAAVALCTGQLQEMENAYNVGLTEAEHLEILKRKTATLFELPCRLGAHLGSVPALYSNALTDYGRSLGIAFQLADDALDLTGRADQMGKATGTDLREGVYSLPVLRAVQRDDATGVALTDLLQRTRLSTAEVQDVLALVAASRTVAEVQELAREYVSRAQAAIRALPDNDAKRSLCRLSDYVLTRTY